MKNEKCSTCILFRHDSAAEADRKGNRPINWCLLNNLSAYRKEKLAYGDDLVACKKHRTEMEIKLEGKGW